MKKISGPKIVVKKISWSKIVVIKISRPKIVVKKILMPKWVGKKLFEAKISEKIFFFINTIFLIFAGIQKTQSFSSSKKSTGQWGYHQTTQLT